VTVADCGYPVLGLLVLLLQTLKIIWLSNLLILTTISYGHLCLREENLNRIATISYGHLRLREENLNRIATISYGHLCLREENLVSSL
jgi:hypothetical protein